MALAHQQPTAEAELGWRRQIVLSLSATEVLPYPGFPFTPPGIVEEVHPVLPVYCEVKGPMDSGTDLYCILPDEQLVEYILEGIDAEMAASAQPTVILFDIGGVVVSRPIPVSPTSFSFIIFFLFSSCFTLSWNLSLSLFLFSFQRHQIAAIAEGESV